MIAQLNSPVLSIDIETYSDVDLKKCGLYKYVESDTFEILLICYKSDEQTYVVDFQKGDDYQHFLEKLLDTKIIKTAFNAQFERVCLNRYFDIESSPGEWDCTALRGLEMGLAASLGETAAKALKLPAADQKIKGWQLINKFCMPVRPTKTNGMKTRLRAADDPQAWEKFKEYCIQDVATENAVREKLQAYEQPAAEKRVYEIDQAINDRGIKVDRALIERVQKLLKTVRRRIEDKVLDLTQIDNVESLSQLKEWISKELKYPITSISQQEIPKILETCSNEKVQEVLTLRQVISKSSVKKYDAILRCLCSDDRLRGMFKKHGANRTGRWAGQLVNLQNLPRNYAKDLDTFRSLVKDQKFDELFLVYTDREIFDYCSQLVRTVFISETGLLAVADFASIEARVIAWLANEQWRLKEFNGEGKIYERAAERMFNLKAGSVNKQSAYRVKGKVAELALAYQGSIGALKQMGALEMGLKEAELQPLVDAWRRANPNIVSYWKDTERAIVEAIATGEPVPLTQTMAARFDGKNLLIRLPSKRELCYVNARLQQDDFGRPKVVYEGQDAITKKWCDAIPSYGGKFVENICQAVARDCLADFLIRLDDWEGVTIVGHVHDEVICEIEEEKKCDAILEEMRKRPDWAADLPLDADGFPWKYYKKD